MTRRNGAAARQRAASPPTPARTVAELTSAHLEYLERRVASGRVQRATLAAVASRYRSVVAPTLGTARLSDLDFERAEKWHSKVSRNRPVAANRAAEALRAAWSLAEQWGWVPTGSNPFRALGAFRNPEKARSRVLTPEETAKLVRELENRASDWKKHGHRKAALAIRLLLETGCRREEIFRLKWASVNLDPKHPRLELAETKTGPKVVTLSDCAVQILRDIPRTVGTDLVFPGIVWVSVWDKIRDAIGCPDLTLHDLRRGFSTRLAEAGIPAEDVAKLLGQRTVSVNIRHYRHLGADRLNELANLASKSLRGGTE